MSVVNVQINDTDDPKTVTFSSPSILTVFDTLTSTSQIISQTFILLYSIPSYMFSYHLHIIISLSTWLINVFYNFRYFKACCLLEIYYIHMVKIRKRLISQNSLIHPVSLKSTYSLSHWSHRRPVTPVLHLQSPNILSQGWLGSMVPVSSHLQAVVTQMINWWVYATWISKTNPESLLQDHNTVFNFNYHLDYITIW